MKRLLLVVGVTALLVAPSRAQAQSALTQNDMTTSEFRQVLLDLVSYLDAHKGTDLRRQFEVLPDDGVRQIHSAVSNPRQLQSAVAALKQHDAEQGAQSRLLNTASPALAGPLAAFPACPTNSIIDNSAGALCTPAYPDPTNGGWQAMVNPLITFGAFSPTSYAAVSSQLCGLTVETNLQQVSVAFQGALNTDTPVCSAIPAPANAACWVPLSLVAATESASAGLFSDCIEQDSFVNAAEIDAAFHNTVTLYNDLNNSVAGLNTHLTNFNSQATTEFSALDTHLTNVDNHIASEFTALDSHLSAVAAMITNLSNTILASFPSAVSVNPNTGSGTMQTFSALYMDPAGSGDLSHVDLLFNTSTNGASACWVYYVPASNSIYLMNDSGTGPVPGSINVSQGRSTLSNGRCTLSSGGQVTTSGNNLTVPFGITFVAGFTGMKNIYGYAQGNGGATRGWQLLGTWTTGP